MNEATYVRFIGIVSRYWDSGFTNGWTGDTTESSNGHIEFINCIGDGNSRTAFAMYSARGFTVRECIAAHSGGSPTHSWSSGVQLYAVKGTPRGKPHRAHRVLRECRRSERNDGSGFIVDEETTGATFSSNIGFRNGGSCMRLTKSPNARMINFSCYHNGMNPDANSPTNPGEFFWTDQTSRDTSILINTIAAASGSATDPAALRFPPDTGVSSNLTIDSGETPFFMDPAGQSPDFRPRLRPPRRWRISAPRTVRRTSTSASTPNASSRRIRTSPISSPGGSTRSTMSTSAASAESPSAFTPSRERVDPILVPTSSAASRMPSAPRAVACAALIRILARGGDERWRQRRSDGRGWRSDGSGRAGVRR